MSSKITAPAPALFTVALDVTAARSVGGTVYQNTTGKPMLVSCMSSVTNPASVDQVYAKIGATSSPDIQAANSAIPALTGLWRNCVVFIVPADWYYQVVAGLGTKDKWTETT